MPVTLKQLRKQLKAAEKNMQEPTQRKTLKELHEQVQHEDSNSAKVSTTIVRGKYLGFKDWLVRPIP